MVGSPVLYGTASLFEFTFATLTTEPPIGSQIRFDAADYESVSKVWVRNVAADGRDVFYGLMAIGVGQALYVQDKNDHTRIVRFDVIDPPIDKTEYVELLVAWRSSSGVPLINGQAVTLIGVAPDTVTPVPPTPGPPDPEPPIVALLSLTEAKTHLRITSTVDDDDITAKTLEASNIVLKYLKGRADPTWTPTTVPPRIKAGVKLLLAHLYEHRGDDPETDEALWAALTRLYARDRDPALA